MDRSQRVLIEGQGTHFVIAVALTVAVEDLSTIPLPRPISNVYKGNADGTQRAIQHWENFLPARRGSTHLDVTRTWKLNVSHPPPKPSRHQRPTDAD